MTCGKNGAFDVFSKELSSENLRRVINTSMGQQGVVFSLKE